MARNANRVKLCAIAAMIALGILAGATDGAAAAGRASETAQLDKGSRATLGELDKLLKEETDDTRRTCASGEAPGCAGSSGIIGFFLQELVELAEGSPAPFVELCGFARAPCGGRAVSRARQDAERNHRRNRAQLNSICITRHIGPG